MKISVVLTGILILFHHYQVNDPELEYLAQTRGFYKHVLISDGNIQTTESNGGDMVQRKLTSTELEELWNLISKIDLERVKIPEERRSSYDAAPFATLRFRKMEALHDFDFDHGHPPIALQELVNKVLTLSEIVE